MKKLLSLFILIPLLGFGQNFITTWQTTTADESITIPTNNTYNYSYVVDWGDGTSDTTTYTGDATHTYTTASTYDVKITGTFPHFDNSPTSNQTNKDQLTAVVQWGGQQWESMSNTFYGCTNLNTLPTIAPDLSNVTDMSGMFRNAKAFNQDIGNWNVASVQSMYKMFYNAEVFNQDIGNWDVASVQRMYKMFYNAKVFNQDISGWDVANVTNMSKMFHGAEAFNQDIGSWNLANVTNMSKMFYGVTLSTNNYDALLAGWAEKNVQSNVNFHAGYSTYCDSGLTAKNTLTDSSGSNWTITDGGKNCTAGAGGIDKNPIEFYPNPIQNNLYIEGLSPGLSIMIYDVLGVQVFSAETSENPVDLSELEGGVCFLQITIDNITSTHKVIKE